MNHSSKGLRVASAGILLLNIVGLFLPLASRVQRNYPTLKPTQFQYIKCLFMGNSPFSKTIGMTGNVKMWVFLLVILPVILSIAAFVIAAATNERQLLSFCITVLVCLLYAGMFATMKTTWPEAIHGQVYTTMYGAYVNMAISVVGLLVGVIALSMTPKKIDKKALAEGRADLKMKNLRDQQLQIAYNNMQKEEAAKAKKTPDNNNPSEALSESAPVMPALPRESDLPKVKPYVPGSEARGVLVGLTGMYAGAEIPFQDGMTIRLGRGTDNDLIFSDQSKISRNHCKLTWDGKNKIFKYRDYSSNGSFVNGSEECLPQNLDMSLVPGTIIALGDNSNTFRLE